VPQQGQKLLVALHEFKKLQYEPFVVSCSLHGLLSSPLHSWDVELTSHSI